LPTIQTNELEMAHALQFHGQEDTMRVKFLGSACVAVLIAGSVPSIAVAQATAAAAASAATETIIVTATRRAESEQKVPISITAVSGETLRETVVRDTQSLQSLAPSLVVTVSNSETTGGVIRIRGVGTQGQNAGLEPTVGVFLDGVYLPRSGIALNELVDVDRVEILRGPQGTLFGKNTTAGAITISTKKPEFTFGGEVFAGAGSLNSQRAGFSITGPVVEDKLALRLAGNLNKRDGFVKDQKLKTDLNSRDRWAIRGQALWTPTDKIDVRIIADTSKKEDVCCAAPYVLNGPRATTIAALGGTVFNPTREADYLTATNLAPTSTVDDKGVSAELNWDLGWAQLRGLASSRVFESVRNADADFSDLDLTNTLNEVSKDETKTFEVTLRGTSGPVDWLVGAFHFDQDFIQSGSVVLGTDAGRYQSTIGARPAIVSLYAAGDGDQLRRFTLQASGWSLFTHNIWAVNDKLDVTLGLRWSQEDKDGSGTFITRSAGSCTSPLVPAALRLICPTRDYQASKSDEKASGVFAASYDISDDILAFASFSKGFKAGGVSLDRDAGNRTRATFDPEESESVEAGFKAQWLDRRLRTNMTFFDQTYTNFQRTVFTGTETLLSNQGEVRSRGVEFDSRWYVGAGFTLTAATTFNLAKYGNEVSDATLRGRRLNAAPEWTTQLGVAWRRQIMEGVTGFARANWRHQSETITGADLDPLKAQPSYGLLNGTLGFNHEASGLEVSAWVSNLTDESYRVVTFNSVAQGGSLNAYMGEPRTWGLEISKTF
jgi:iron complex outermembrane receptor protein